MDPDKQEALAYIESEMVDKHNIEGVRPMFEFSFEDKDSLDYQQGLKQAQEDENHEHIENEHHEHDHHEHMEHENDEHNEHMEHEHGEHHEHDELDHRHGSGHHHPEGKVQKVLCYEFYY